MRVRGVNLVSRQPNVNEVVGCFFFIKGESLGYLNMWWGNDEDTFCCCRDSAQKTHVKWALVGCRTSTGSRGTPVQCSLQGRNVTDKDDSQKYSQDGNVLFSSRIRSSTFETVSTVRDMCTSPFLYCTSLLLTASCYSPWCSWRSSFVPSVTVLKRPFHQTEGGNRF